MVGAVWGVGGQGAGTGGPTRGNRSACPGWLGGSGAWRVLFLVLPRRTDPTPDQQLLLHQLNLKLPEQPPPRISAWKTDPASTSVGTL